MNEHFGVLLKDELVALKELTELQLNSIQSSGSRGSGFSDGHTIIGGMQYMQLESV